MLYHGTLDTGPHERLVRLHDAPPWEAGDSAGDSAGEVGDGLDRFVVAARNKKVVVHAADDDIVPVEDSILLGDAVILPEGGHRLPHILVGQ